MSRSGIWVLATVAMGGALAHGQPAGGRAHLGPVRCYMEAAETFGLEHLKAKQLCRGAIDEAPARCFEEATDRVGMADLQAVRLCQAARSVAPAMCAERLDDTTSLGVPSIVEYCAALRWPLVPAGTGGAPECIEAALDRTTLSDDQAAWLCAGSRSIAPVECYELGDDETTLSDRDLVELCTRVVIAAPYVSWYP